LPTNRPAAGVDLIEADAFPPVQLRLVVLLEPALADLLARLVTLELGAIQLRFADLARIADEADTVLSLR
jgi:hypothetical protein